MVIVDIRAKGGRGDTGIPTDAYFAVEEIRDVSSLYMVTSMNELMGRTEQQPSVHSPISPHRSKRKKPRKSE
jgi:hypothetical protein